MTAILKNPVGIHIGNIRIAVGNRPEIREDLIIVRMRTPLFQVRINFLRIQVTGCRFGDAKRHFPFFLSQRIPEQRQTDGGHHRRNEKNRHRNHDQNFGAQGKTFYFDPFPICRSVPVKPKTASQGIRYQQTDQGDNSRCNRLVQQINQQIGTELRKEHVHPTRLKKRQCQRPRDSLPDSSAIQKPGQNAAQSASDERKDQHRQQNSGKAPETALFSQSGRGQGEEHADTAVIDRCIVKDPVNQVGDNAGDDSRNQSAQHRCQNGPDTVKKHRETEMQGCPDPDKVNQDPGRAQNHQEGYPPFAFSGIDCFSHYLSLCASSVRAQFFSCLLNMRC